jgi:hypothetical protein
MDREPLSEYEWYLIHSMNSSLPVWRKASDNLRHRAIWFNKKDIEALMSGKVDLTDRLSLNVPSRSELPSLLARHSKSVSWHMSNE